MQNKIFSNNIKMLFYYVLILIFTFAILAGINIMNIKLDMNFNNLIVKIFFLVIYIWIFILAGNVIGTRGSYYTDFSNYILVFIIGLFIYLTAWLGGGLESLDSMNLVTLPGYIYLSPYILISTIIGIDFSIIVYLVLSLIFSIIIGLSLRRKRVKQRNKRRR